MMGAMDNAFKQMNPLMACKCLLAYPKYNNPFICKYIINAEIIPDDRLVEYLPNFAKYCLVLNYTFTLSTPEYGIYWFHHNE